MFIYNNLQHEDYDALWQFNDIAVLQLRHPLDMSNGVISPVQVSDNLFDEEAKTMTDSCFISGWGLFHDGNFSIF